MVQRVHFHLLGGREGRGSWGDVLDSPFGEREIERDFLHGHCEATPVAVAIPFSNISPLRGEITVMVTPLIQSLPFVRGD